MPTTPAKTEGLTTYLPVANATAISEGDLCAMSSGNVIRASSVPWNTNLATTQADLAAALAGISASKKDANFPVFGNTDGTIRIVTEGEFLIDLQTAVNTVAGTTFFAPAKATGDALLDQVYAITTVANSAIFQALETKTSTTTVRAALLRRVGNR